MASAVQSSLLTAEQFAVQCADTPWCELYRGEVIRLAPAGHEHNEASSNAHLLIGNWARKSKRGRAFTNEPGVITERGPDTVRGADVVFFSYERLPRGKEPDGFYSVAPELVVEVTGKGQSRAQLAEKAGEYLRMGVDSVWVIDPRSRSLRVYKGIEPPFDLPETAELRDDRILPGFSCRVSEFFAD